MRCFVVGRRCWFAVRSFDQVFLFRRIRPRCVIRDLLKKCLGCGRGSGCWCCLQVAALFVGGYLGCGRVIAALFVLGMAAGLVVALVVDYGVAGFVGLASAYLAGRRLRLAGLEFDLGVLLGVVLLRFCLVLVRG